MLLYEQIKRLEERKIGHHAHAFRFLEWLFEYEATVLIQLIFHIEQPLGNTPDLFMLEALIEIVKKLPFGCFALLIDLIIDRKTPEDRHSSRDHGRIYRVEEDRRDE